MYFAKEHPRLILSPLGPEPMTFFGDLAKNVTIVLYSGNNDPLLSHRGTECTRSTLGQSHLASRVFQWSSRTLHSVESRASQNVPTLPLLMTRATLRVLFTKSAISHTPYSQVRER